ncbi:hypothetical protein JCM5353_000051 [Sporobolomyces roseus]
MLRAQPTLLGCFGTRAKSAVASNRSLPPQKPSKRPPPPPSEPEKLLPDIVYEDERFLILNKPSGMAIQGQFGSPARRHWEDLCDSLRSRPESPSIHPVHRLDKATTGTLLIAKSTLHAARLSQQLEKHQIQRKYLAIVFGQLKVGFKGVVEDKLRVDEDRVRVARGREGEPEGVEARTEWECVASSPSYSLLSLSPSTGRKHQLRVHLAECLQAPIVGDYKYGQTSPHFETLSELSIPQDSVLLHSAKISFYAWGKDRKRQTITAEAPLPAGFERFCRAHKLTVPSV